MDLLRANIANKLAIVLQKRASQLGKGFEVQQMREQLNKEKEKQISF
jgi:hypothetical protein